MILKKLPYLQNALKSQKKTLIWFNESKNLLIWLAHNLDPFSGCIKITLVKFLTFLL